MQDKTRQDMATITIMAFPPLKQMRRREEDHESGCCCDDRARTRRFPQNLKKVKAKKKKISNADLICVDTSKARGHLDVLRLCIKDLGWKEFPAGRRMGPCDFYWHSGCFSDTQDLYTGKVSKFPGMTEVSHKISLARALSWMKSLYPEQYDFFPRTWLLPQEYHEFCAEIEIEKRNNPKHKYTFIVKPNEGSQGDGIYLIREPRDYHLCSRMHVVQEYVAKPLLLEKLKFDLRVYVVLVSIDPVRIYIYKEGMARFCTIPYQTPSSKNIRESYMHLTNYSLNKYSSTYSHTDNKHDGSKRTLRSVFLQMERCGFDATKAWEEIERSTVKTILAMIPELRIAYNAEIPSGKPGPTCFQILGFDYLLTHDLKPVLLEVNSSPSLRIDHEKEIAIGSYEYVPSVIDEEIKRPLIRETLRLLAPPDKLARSKKQEDTFDMVIEAVEKEQRLTRSQSCDEDDELLVEIYPSKYGQCYRELTLLDRIASIFQASLSVRQTVRMGSSGFRSFARRCKLTSQGITNAELDIIFIEQSRRWDFLNPDGTAGLNLQGFMEAFCSIARRKFYCSRKSTMVENLVDFCEANMQFSSKSHGRGTNFPDLNTTKASQRRLQDLKSIYISQRKARFRRPGDSLFLEFLHQAGEVARAKIKEEEEKRNADNSKKTVIK